MQYLLALLLACSCGQSQGASPSIRLESTKPVLESAELETVLVTLDIGNGLPDMAIHLSLPSSVDPSTLVLTVEDKRDHPSYETAELHQKDTTTWTASAHDQGIRWEKGDPLTLIVRDEDGFLYGSARSEWGWPASTPIPIHVEPTGTLAFEDGILTPEESLRTIQREGDVSIVRVIPLDEPTLALDDNRRSKFNRRLHGVLYLRWMPPGEYRVGISSRNHHEQQVALGLAPGQKVTIRAKLERIRETRSVRGRIVDERGKEKDDVLSSGLRLSLIDEPKSSWHITVDFIGGCGTGIDHRARTEKHGNTESKSFLIRSVQQGKLLLRPEALPGCGTDFRIIESANGDLEINLTRFDQAAGPGHGFRVRSRAEDFETYSVQLRGFSDAVEISSRGNCGEILFREIPNARDLEWAILRPGYRTAYGSHGAFLSEGIGRFFAEVTLHEGWGTRVLVQDEALLPLADAVVSVDGEPVGTTDASGYVDLVLDTAPDRIEATYLDWQPKGDVSGVSTRRVSSDAWHRITLVRP